MEIIAPNPVADPASAPFTRGTVANYWDRSGVLQQVGPDVLRVTYDPTDLSAAPYPLIEPGNTNLFTGSDSLNGAGWGSNGGALQDANVTDPRGGANASRWNLTAYGHGRYFIMTGQVVGSIFTFSVYYRYVAGGGRIWLNVENAGNAYFDAASCTLVSSDGNATAQVAKGVNGWNRLTVSITVLSASFATAVYAADASPLTIDVYGAQFEPGYAATSYITSGTAPGFRVADVLAPGVYGLIASNVIESDTADAPLWDAGTAYAIATRVRRPNHRVYRALQASTGKTPEQFATSDATAIWQDVGPTQRWAPFDGNISTTTSAPEEVYYVLRPGAVTTAVGVFGMDSSDIRTSVVDAAGVPVYQRTKNLRIKTSRSMSDYLFKPIVRRPDEVFDDLPPFKNGLICITARKPGSVAKIGDLVIGRLENAGTMQWKPEIRTLRRSTITDDGFGNLTFNKKRSSKLITCDVRIENERVDDVVRLLDNYTDEPCVIIGDTHWTSLICLGYIQDFRLTLDGPAGSLYNAQIQGFAQ